MTKWKDVAGFEGYYEVSDDGRVRSVDRVVLCVNRWGQQAPRTYPGQELMAYPNEKRGGYRYVNLHKEGQKMRRVAVLVAEAFLGPRPAGTQVCHRNGEATDDRAANLRYDTPKGNAADQSLHGTRRKGESHPMARLSDSDVDTIRLLHNLVPKADLAERFGVHPGHISNIQNGWRRGK